MNKSFCKLCRFIDGILRDYFAGFKVVDCHGTEKLCWTMKEAQEWLPFCSHSVRIVETYDYNVLVQRVQGYRG